MSDARIGYGSRFEIGSSDSPGTWTPIAEVTDITPPSDTVDMIEVTHMQSPDRRKEFIPGLSDPGEASFTMNFIPGSAGDILLRGLVGSGEKRACRIIFENNQIWEFEGFITGYNPTVPTNDKMTAEVSIKVTGSITTGSSL